MSGLAKTFVYSTLRDFLDTGLRLPKMVQVIPYAYIRESREVLPILTISNLGFLTDFGGTYSSLSSLVSYIENSIKENSLGTLEVTNEYILKNASIAYTKVYDVSKAVHEIYSPISPVVFVRYEFERSEDLEQLIRDFRLLFSKRSEGIYQKQTLSSTYNLTFLNPEDLFYTLRQTTATIQDPKSGLFYKLNVEEKGFPADPRITNIYQVDPTSGDIPFGHEINQYANCCPEVKFYSEVSSILKLSILSFFSVELPILQSVEEYKTIKVEE